MEHKPPKYQQIDHTADVGIKIYGETLAELFCHAALGMFDVIANLETVALIIERKIQVEATDLEALLVAWLSELNYLFFTEEVLFKDFKIELIDDSKLLARVRGEKIDENKHEIYTEVKAVTYHKLYVTKKEQGWEAQVIFDL
ncbi:MAG: archease [bacterium]